jgi:hypothetical protein
VCSIGMMIFSERLPGLQGRRGAPGIDCFTRVVRTATVRSREKLLLAIPVAR